jgi:hypothetical protein
MIRENGGDSGCGGDKNSRHLINGSNEKIHKKTGCGQDTEKTKKAAPAAAEAPCPGRPAGGGVDGDPHRPFGPCLGGPYFFPFPDATDGFYRNAR